MLAQKSSKTCFLWKAFWKSSCGQCLLVSLFLIIIIIALIGFLRCLVKFNLDFMQVDYNNLVGMLFLQICMIWFIIIFFYIVYQGILTDCQNFKQHRQTCWKFLPHSVLIKPIIITMFACLLLYVIYQLNIWMIDSHYVSPLGKNHTVSRNAAELLLAEVIFTPIMLFFVTCAVASIAFFVILVYNLMLMCMETKQNMLNELHNFETHESLLQQKDLV